MGRPFPSLLPFFSSLALVPPYLEVFGSPVRYRDAEDNCSSDANWCPCRPPFPGVVTNTEIVGLCDKLMKRTEAERGPLLFFFPSSSLFLPSRSAGQFEFVASKLKRARERCEGN